MVKPLEVVVPIFPWFESSISHNDLCRAGFIKYIYISEKKGEHGDKKILTLDFFILIS